MRIIIKYFEFELEISTKWIRNEILLQRKNWSNFYTHLICTKRKMTIDNDIDDRSDAGDDNDVRAISINFIDWLLQQTD